MLAQEVYPVPKITEDYNFGDKSEINFEKLLRSLQEMYKDLASAINKKPDVYQRDTDGQVGDTFLSNGDININLTNDKVEMITNHPTTSTVTWITL